MGAQPGSASSCPPVCPYPCVHADLSHPEVYPCFHVHMCACVHAPRLHWLCTHTMGLHPQHPALYTPAPIAGGGMAVPRGAVAPGKDLDVPALPPHMLCWAKGLAGLGQVALLA